MQKNSKRTITYRTAITAPPDKRLLPLLILKLFQDERETRSRKDRRCSLRPRDEEINPDGDIVGDKKKEEDKYPQKKNYGKIYFYISIGERPMDRAKAMVCDILGIVVMKEMMDA